MQGRQTILEFLTDQNRNGYECMYLYPPMRWSAFVFELNIIGEWKKKPPCFVGQINLWWHTDDLEWTNLILGQHRRKPWFINKLEWD